MIELLTAKHIILFLLVGTVAGILSASMGIGGGVLMVPVLVTLFHYEQKSAQGISLAYIVPVALVGALRYCINPDVQVNLKIAGLLVLGGIVGAFIGEWLAFWLSAGALRKAFACLMLIVAMKMFLTSASSGKAVPSARGTTAAMEKSAHRQGP